jgi:hypothetical protein
MVQAQAQAAEELRVKSLSAEQQQEQQLLRKIQWTRALL